MVKCKLWGGFTGGKLDWFHADCGWGGFGTGDFTAMPAVFRRKKDALAKYQDVREVDIIAITGKQRRR